MKYDAVEQARNYLLEKTGSSPDIAVIMGSGVSAAEDILEHPTRIHYVTIPNFPLPKVAGHRAQAIFGKAHGMNVLVFEGRVHYYEGASMDDVTLTADDVVVSSQHVVHHVGMVLPQTRRTLHIGEQEGDRPRGQSASAHAVARP